jgi:ATP-dependent Clp protease protease subunit
MPSRKPTPTEAAVRAAQIKKEEAETRFLAELTRKTQIETSFAEDIRREVDSSQHVARIYSFNGSVSDNSANNCIATLGQWQREDPNKPVTLVFNSPGGSVTAGLALYDYIQVIRANGTRVDTHSIGWAASMGGILLQAGEKRSMGDHAYMLIHEISSGAIGNASELEDELKFVKRLQSRLLGILASRATLSKRQIERRWKRKDWWLDAQEALEFGFIDAIE